MNRAYLFANGAHENVPRGLEFPQTDDATVGVKKVSDRALAILANAFGCDEFAVVR